MYSFITSGMTWSYSRISSFSFCPYKFFITYIKPCEGERLFFAEYGSFVHRILASYYNKELTKEETVMEYITKFRDNIPCKAPSLKIFENYFQQGLEHFQQLNEPENETIGVEKEVHFNIDGFPFIGYIDLVMRDKKDDRIIVCDHKSHALKSRSHGKKRRKSDDELDEYLRQLYLYSIPIKEIYGEYPKQLMFNCYRTGNKIYEDFSNEKLEEAKCWAVNSINSIIKEQNFDPNYNQFSCRNLCPVHNNCDFYQMMARQ